MWEIDEFLLYGLHLYMFVPLRVRISAGLLYSKSYACVLYFRKCLLRWLAASLSLLPLRSNFVFSTLSFHPLSSLLFLLFPLFRSSSLVFSPVANRIRVPRALEKDLRSKRSPRLFNQLRKRRSVPGDVKRKRSKVEHRVVHLRLGNGFISMVSAVATTRSSTR